MKREVFAWAVMTAIICLTIIGAVIIFRMVGFADERQSQYRPCYIRDI